MIKYLLGYFGYVKIPKAAVQLSFKVESDLKILLEHLTSPSSVELIIPMYNASHTLTEFLRSGRFITYGND